MAKQRPNQHDDAEEEIEYVSRTQMKREVEALQQIGEKLTELSDDKLKRVPMSDELRAAIEESRRIKPRTSAMKRHLNFVGKIMRTEDAEAIQAAMAVFEAGSAQNTQIFHKLERWRDRLISDDNTALSSFIEEYPSADIQHIRQLTRNSQREAKQNKPAASAKKLFKYLRELEELN